jgi:MFS family permease
VTSSGLSNLADGVFKIALPLVAIRYTRSPALVAGLELVRSLPWLAGALHVGALTDRLDRRRTMLAANATRAAFAALPALALLMGEGSLALLYVAAIGTGTAEVFYDTSAQSILPSLVPRPMLDRANGRLFAVELGAQEFAGPPLAGVLVAVGLVAPFLSSTGLWIVALLALVAVSGTFRPERVGPRTSLASDIRQGIAFLWNQPVLRRLSLMVGMSNLASSAVFAVLVLFAVGPESAMGLSEPAFGFLIGFMAAGGVVGGLVAEGVAGKIGRSRTLTLSVVGMAAYVGTLALTADVIVIAVVMFLSGLTTMMWNVTTVTFRQRATPDHLLGRLNSAYRLVAWGTRPLGAALGGAIGQWLGVRSVFALMTVVALAVLIPDRHIDEAAMADAERDAG